MASNLIIVHLKFPSSNVDMTILDARYTWSDQIASFGGIFGIWGELTGITFLGIINICLNIVKLFTCIYKKLLPDRFYSLYFNSSLNKFLVLTILAKL